VRGLVLVAVAAVLGFFLLRAIDDSGSGIVVETDTSTSEDAAGATTPESSETTAPPIRPQSEVIVIVANASGVSGAARTQTDRVTAASYQAVEPANAPEGMELSNTEILPSAGFEQEAARLATELGLPPESVKPMTDPPPVDMAGANILVLLGTDIAEG
jgi:hypothetical protein